MFENNRYMQTTKNKEDDPSIKAPDSRRVLRIADILLGDEDADSFEIVEMEQQPRKSTIPHVQCTTPRRIVSRWISALKRGRPRKVNARSTSSANKIVKEIGADLPNGFKSEGGSSGGGGGGGGGSCGVNSRSFNLGVACGLACVIAAGKNELNKMVELRTQMELILQNAKQGLESNKSLLVNKPAESNETKFSSFSTNFQQASSTSGSQFSLQSVAVRDECSFCVGNERGEDEDLTGIDQLESELQAELERLQLHLGDSESNSSISKSPQRLKGMGDNIGSNRHEADSASTDYSDEMLWGSGVCPLELERKLHQVLEARQQERIKELEDALECVEQKLEEKEIEVSWWKDTARLVSGLDS